MVYLCLLCFWFDVFQCVIVVSLCLVLGMMSYYGIYVSSLFLVWCVSLCYCGIFMSCRVLGMMSYYGISVSSLFLFWCVSVCYCGIFVSCRVLGMKSYYGISVCSLFLWWFPLSLCFWPSLDAWSFFTHKLTFLCWRAIKHQSIDS